MRVKEREREVTPHPLCVCLPLSLSVYPSLFLSFSLSLFFLLYRRHCELSATSVFAVGRERTCKRRSVFGFYSVAQTRRLLHPFLKHASVALVSLSPLSLIPLFSLSLSLPLSLFSRKLAEREREKSRTFFLLSSLSALSSSFLRLGWDGVLRQGVLVRHDSGL